MTTPRAAARLVDDVDGLVRAGTSRRSRATSKATARSRGGPPGRSGAGRRASGRRPRNRRHEPGARRSRTPRSRPGRADGRSTRARSSTSIECMLGLRRKLLLLRVRRGRRAGDGGRRRGRERRLHARRRRTRRTPHHTTTAYYVILGFTGAIFVIVEGLLVAFVVKYRSRGREPHRSRACRCTGTRGSR